MLYDGDDAGPPEVSPTSSSQQQHTGLGKVNRSPPTHQLLSVHVMPASFIVLIILYVWLAKVLVDWTVRLRYPYTTSHTIRAPGQERTQDVRARPGGSRAGQAGQARAS